MNAIAADSRVFTARQEVVREFTDRLVDEPPGLPPFRPSDISLTMPCPTALPNPRLMFRPVRHSAPEADFLRRYFRKLADLGLIRPSSSRFNSPVFCVPKDLDNPDPDKHFRPVMDPRLINQLFERLSTALPPIPSVLQQVGSARFVTCFDLIAGFHQIRVPEE